MYLETLASQDGLLAQPIEFLARAALSRLGPVGLPPGLGEALARVGQIGFQLADLVLKFLLRRRSDVEGTGCVSQRPFGLKDLFVVTALSLRSGLSRRRWFLGRGLWGLLGGWC